MNGVQVYMVNLDGSLVEINEDTDWKSIVSVEEDKAKAKKQDAANHIKEFMGDYDKAKCYDHSISWKRVTSERFDTKALKENEPELYQKYVKSSTSRRFTLR